MPTSRSAMISDVSGTKPLAVEYWPIDRLIPYARNARTHSDAQVAEIAGSIRAFGFANPILVGADGDIIAGHGRLVAARKLGLPEVPVIVLADLTEVQRRQLVLADNRIALNAGWDADLLSLELQDLSAIGCDLKMLGFTKAELATVLSGDPQKGLTDEDEIPNAADSAIAAAGNVWVLGDHRLACGDSTDVAIVKKLLGAVAPNLMVTDPPYGVDYDPGWRNERGISNSRRKGKVLNDGIADWSDAWALFPGEIAYVWHAGLRSATVLESLTKTGFAVRAQIIWAKTRLVIGRGDYQWQHEPCWYAVRKKGNWTGDRKQTTLWTIASKDQDAETVHGTQKPVECMRRPILNNSGKGDAVYDPFLGSGTTLIAAETVNRRCFGIELNPAYVDVVIRRWQAFTGRDAVREADGVTFADLERERGAKAAGIARCGPCAPSCPQRGGVTCADANQNLPALRP